MTTTEWIDQAIANKTILREFLQGWHPRSGYKARGRRVQIGDDDEIELDINLPITAPLAESECAVVRSQIKHESTADPLVEFDSALRDRDDGAVYRLLNAAWFGVPESTSCWSIPGFSEAVDLLEDPPEPEE